MTRSRRIRPGKNHAMLQRAFDLFHLPQQGDIHTPVSRRELWIGLKNNGLVRPKDRNTAEAKMAKSIREYHSRNWQFTPQAHYDFIMEHGSKRPWKELSRAQKGRMARIILDYFLDAVNNEHQRPGDPNHVPFTLENKRRMVVLLNKFARLDTQEIRSLEKREVAERGPLMKQKLGQKIRGAFNRISILRGIRDGLENGTITWE